MKNLKQNNLESGTTELGFVKTMNENVGEGTVKLIREVELESGEKVQVEGVTPHGMKKMLNLVTESREITFATPGENYDIEGTGENTEPGVVRMYNEGLAEASVDTTSLEDEESNTDENPDGEDSGNDDSDNDGSEE